jgi:hypothetical protein
MSGLMHRLVLVLAALLGLVALLGSRPAWPASGGVLQCPPARPLPALPDEPVAHSHGLLWRIDVPDAAPSYLFGTIHFSNPKILALAAPVEQALNQADSFIMEALIDDQGAADFMQRMYFHDGHRLEPLLGQALYDRTAALLARYGLSPEAAATIRPWGAFIMLSEPPAERDMPLDLVLMLKARAKGAKIYGLESIKEQAGVFADLRTADQIALLRDSVCDFDQLQAQFTRLEALYLKRDLAGLQHLSEQYEQPGNALERKVMDRLLVRRNRRMARRLIPHLRAGNAFIAIGALHLPGATGVLSLLERQGFTVTAVY